MLNIYNSLVKFANVECTNNCVRLNTNVTCTYWYTKNK